MTYFEKLEKFCAKKYNDISDFLETLTNDEKEMMSKEVAGWSEEQLELTKSLLKPCAEVSSFFVKNLLASNLVLAGEAYLNKLDDTLGREILYNTLAKFLEVRDEWPKYCDNINIEEFIKEKIVPKIEYEMSKEKHTSSKRVRLI